MYAIVRRKLTGCILVMKQPPPTSREELSAETSYRAAFAERLKRATKSYEIAELALKIGVTPTTLYRWLNAQFDPSLPKLAEVAEAMKVKQAWSAPGVGPYKRRPE